MPVRPARPTYQLLLDAAEPRLVVTTFLYVQPRACRGIYTYPALPETTSQGVEFRQLKARMLLTLYCDYHLETPCP